MAHKSNVELVVTDFFNWLYFPVNLRNMHFKEERCFLPNLCSPNRGYLFNFLPNLSLHFTTIRLLGKVGSYQKRRGERFYGKSANFIKHLISFSAYSLRKLASLPIGTAVPRSTLKKEKNLKRDLASVREDQGKVLTTTVEFLITHSFPNNSNGKTLLCFVDSLPSSSSLDYEDEDESTWQTVVRRPKSGPLTPFASVLLNLHEFQITCLKYQRYLLFNTLLVNKEKCNKYRFRISFKGNWSSNSLQQMLDLYHCFAATHDDAVALLEHGWSLVTQLESASPQFSLVSSRRSLSVKGRYLLFVFLREIHSSSTALKSEPLSALPCSVFFQKKKHSSSKLFLKSVLPDLEGHCLKEEIRTFKWMKHPRTRNYYDKRTTNLFTQKDHNFGETPRKK
ncbi:hypothetical protein EGR_03201 [Echinococcus granulosus]|uniref:Uncharacterized protein n=1 Tax=Echinococcus granulosus TaxID=6210 RepID=W6ULG3_ECHGR|nr:hypothetical protein EGR_03201 [Echinococcus granulosus]EUB61928.1 hypothetical protein EGR_03201 [Echinococcus granulosus]